MDAVEKIRHIDDNSDDVEEDVALLTDSINAIQAELFQRQMLKEKLENRVAKEAQKIADRKRISRSNNEEIKQEKVELLYQPTELNIGNKKLLSLYLDKRDDELKQLLKEADSGGVSSVHTNKKESNVFVNVRCGDSDDYCLRLKLPKNTTFGEVCKAAKDFFGIPKQLKVVLRDQMGNFFSDEVDMQQDFSMLPEQNLYLVHVTPPELADLQKYQISDMENVHTGGLSRRKRDESRGIRIMSGLISDLPKSLLIFIIMSVWLFGGEVPAESSALHSKISDTFFKPRFGKYHEHTLKSVTNVDLIWDYLTGPLTNIMFTSSNGVQGVLEDSTYILGSIRLRQQRVKKESCRSRTTGDLDECYGPYHGRISGRVTDDRGTSDYWGNPICSKSNSPQQTAAGVLVESAFTKFIDSTLESSSGFVTDTEAEYFEGTLAHYDPSGYVLEVAIEDRAKFSSIISALKECQWIDLATRIIYVEVNFFNPTMNTYLVGHLSFEIDTTGLVIPDIFFQTLLLDVMSSRRQFITFGLECAIFLWCIYQANRWRSDLVVTMEDTGSIIKWFLNIWTILEIMIVVIFLWVFSLHIYYLLSPHRLQLLNANGKSDKSDPLLSTSFVHLGSLAYRYTQNQLWVCLVTFFSFLKLLKYMKVGRAPRILINTLQYAATPMSVFLLMFLLIMSGYTMFFHSIYGTQFESFSTVKLSTRSLLTSMVSTFVSESEHHQQMMEIPWRATILYPVLFMLFLLICHFVLFNFFLAIMNDAHKVAHDIAERTKEEFPPLSINILVGALCGRYMARKCGDTSVKDVEENVAILEDDDNGSRENTPSELEEENELSEEDLEEKVWMNAAEKVE